MPFVGQPYHKSNSSSSFIIIPNDVISPNIEADLSNLIDLRRQSINNPMIAYLNISSLRNKINYLRDIYSKSLLDIFCIYETKIDSSFPDAQFPLPRKDCNQTDGGKIVYMEGNITKKHLTDLEGKHSEKICLEIKHIIFQIITTNIRFSVNYTIL